MTKRKTLNIPDDLFEQIADYRFGNRIHSESEAVRRLLAAGLAAERPLAPDEDS